MDLVKVKIQPDDNITKYVIKIRKAFPSESIGDIKQRILDGDYVITHDLDAFDPAEEFTTSQTQYKRNLSFLDLLDALEMMGAKLEINLHDRDESLELLSNWIHTIEGINIDCDKYSD